MSKSIVARTYPCADNAWPPTIRKSAPVADNSRNISTKFGFSESSTIDSPRLPCDVPRQTQSFTRCHGENFLIELRLLAELVFPHRYVGSRHVSNYIPRYTRRTQAASS